MCDNPFCLGEPSLGESREESKKMEFVLAIFSNIQTFNFSTFGCLASLSKRDAKTENSAISTVYVQNIMAGLYRYSKNKPPSGTVVPNFMNSLDSIFRDLMLIIYWLKC